MLEVGFNMALICLLGVPPCYPRKAMEGGNLWVRKEEGRSCRGPEFRQNRRRSAKFTSTKKQKLHKKKTSSGKFRGVAFLAGILLPHFSFWVFLVSWFSPSCLFSLLCLIVLCLFGGRSSPHSPFLYVFLVCEFYLLSMVFFLNGLWTPDLLYARGFSLSC